MLTMLRSTLFLAAMLCASITQAQLTIDVTAYSTRCSGSATGLAELTPVGAIGAVSYATSFDLTSLAAGSYAFQASDEGGQTVLVEFDILDHPASCGCTYPQAFNFDLSAEVDNGSCVFATDQSCLADIVPDGVVGTNDLLQLLVEFGEICE